MRVLNSAILTDEEKESLLSIVFSQNYALELVRCELADIENGDKMVSREVYREIANLYDKLDDGIIKPT
ncbi:antirepressor AbbA [Litchfieldia alkalitelluris]|uniref:antirepressor AbbA n=1 Tax=Litchfieldia alkalitelluris TaxID=304268 RepID=UPI00099784E0|nr:antirepressor AbbA [Litchfieldia alkalitelluris]